MGRLLHYLIVTFVAVFAAAKGQQGPEPDGANIRAGYHQREQSKNSGSKTSAQLSGEGRCYFSLSFCSADLLWNQQPSVGRRLHFLHPGSQQTGHRHSSEALSEVNKEAKKEAAVPHTHIEG